MSEELVITSNSLPFDVTGIWKYFPHTYAYYASRVGRREEWQAFNHLVYALKIVAHELARGNARIIVNMPPRHGKSLTFSKWLPLWYLSRNKHHNVLLASYEKEIATDWTMRARDEAVNNMRIGIPVSGRMKADLWETTHGGGMMAAGIGSAITGRGAHLAIIDDPVKDWKQAHSPTYQEDCIDWFLSTFLTRLEPGGNVIVNMTRWTPEDLVGFLHKTQSTEWTLIRLPALAENFDPLGRLPGEALCPERYTADVLNSRRTLLGEWRFSGLYQQRPTPASGGIFTREGFNKRYKMLPGTYDDALVSMDCAFKKTLDSSYVVIGTIYRVGGVFYVADVVRARMNYPTTKRVFKDYCEAHPKITKRLIESKANGPAIIDDLKNDVGGLLPWNPEGKETQAHMVSPYQESGNLLLPEQAPWVHEYVEEMVLFPHAEHDDQVDMTCQGVLRLLQDARGEEKITVPNIDANALADLGRHSPWLTGDG